MTLEDSTAKISVILPFYNSAKTIQRALCSVRNQTFKNFECILANNNSNDDSIIIAKKFEKDDKRFRLIREKRQGVVFASNKAESFAKGAYICRMDADDWMFPDRLTKQAEFLDNNKDYDVISGMVEYVSHKKNTDGFKRYVDWVNSVQTDRDILLQRFIESPIINPTAMWRSTVSKQFGMYKNGDFPEDYELWLRWLAAGVKVAKIKYKLIKWYDSDERLSRTDARYRQNAFYEIKSKYLAEWLTLNNPYHPKIVVWGASRLSRKRAKILERYQIEISHYIDISPKRKLDKDVVLYSDMGIQENIFLLVYMAHPGIRAEIKDFLNNRGYREGYNYLLIS